MTRCRFLALGDSYTIGEGVAPDETWPAVLTMLLRERGVATGDPVVVARTGWTTEELAAGIDAARPEPPFDFVTLLAGVNDQYRGYPLEAYRTALRALLDRAVALAGGDPARVLVLSIPDWSVTPFAGGQDRAVIAAEIDAFNGVNREEAAARGSRWYDVTAASRRAAGDPALVAEDGLHPSAAMYREWAEGVVPVAAAILDACGGRG